MNTTRKKLGVRGIVTVLGQLRTISLSSGYSHWIGIFKWTTYGFVCLRRAVETETGMGARGWVSHDDAPSQARDLYSRWNLE
ncbi:MAG: hypothetical protein AAB899_03860 [Patescibacteria group bacterium]